MHLFFACSGLCFLARVYFLKLAKVEILIVGEQGVRE